MSKRIYLSKTVPFVTTSKMIENFLVLVLPICTQWCLTWFTLLNNLFYWARLNQFMNRQSKYKQNTRQIYHILFDQEHGGRQRSNDNKIVKRRADDNGLANPLIFESVELDQLFNPMNVGQTHHGRSTKPKILIQNEIQIKSINWVKRNDNKFIWRFFV